MVRKSDSRRMRKLRSQFREECERNQTNCWLCSAPIEYERTYYDKDTGKVDPEAFSLDHLYPVSTHPDHAEDPGNFRASHSRCNLERSNKVANKPIKNPSRNWLS